MKVILLNNSKLFFNEEQYLKRVTMNTQRGLRSGIKYTSDLEAARKFKNIEEANQYMQKYGLTSIFHIHVVDRL